MRGNISKRGKNSYRIRLSLGFDPATGKYRQLSMTVKGTKRDAERKLAELIQQVDSGILIAPEKMTVEQFLERWLKDYVQVNLSPKTAEGYEHLIRKRLKPHIGKISLGQLRPIHIQNLYSDLLSNGVGKSVVAHCHTCLHIALNYAVRWGFVARNMADAANRPRTRQSIINVLDEDSLPEVLEKAKDTPYYPLFYLMAYTGMRRGEVLALRWCDVDLSLAQIHINQSLQTVRGKR